MATWKRVLTAGDAVSDNIGTSNLTISGSLRTLTLGEVGGIGIFQIRENGGNSLLSVSKAGGQSQVTVTADLKIQSDPVGSDAGVLKFYPNGGTTNFIGFKAPSLSSATTFVLPDDDGTNGQALVTDGSGNLSFSTVSGSGSIDGTGASSKIAIWSDTDTLTNDTDLSWASFNNTLSSVNFTASGSVTCDGLFADRIVIGKEPSTTAAGAYDGNGSRVFSKVGAITSPVSPQGKIWYLQGSGSGSWALADKDAEASSTGLLALWPNTGGPSTMVREGAVRMASNAGFSSATAGTPVYLGDDGAVQTAVPGTGDIARIVGYVLNATNRVIYFCPDNSYVKVT